MSGYATVQSSKFKVRRPGWAATPQDDREGATRLRKNAISCSVEQLGAMENLAAQVFPQACRRNADASAMYVRNCQRVPLSHRRTSHVSHVSYVSHPLRRYVARWRSTDMCPFRAGYKTSATRGELHAVLRGALPSTQNSNKPPTVACDGATHRWYRQRE